MVLSCIPLWTSLRFQNIIRRTNSLLESLHDIIIVWLTIILIIVIIVGLGILFSPYAHLELDSKGLELTWTILPVFILIRLAFPRIYLLCYQDRIKRRLESSIKITRRQWRWSSEYLEESVDHLIDFELFENISALERPVILPKGVLRLLLTRRDVLHSLGIPRLGVKLDSIPGRLNFTTLETKNKSSHWGSCYELCGNGHSAIPVSFFTY